MGNFWEPSAIAPLGRRDGPWVEDGATAGADADRYLGRALRPGQLWWTAGLLATVLLVLALRAFDLQVAQGGRYRGLAEGNRVREEVVLAPRGNFYDRFGTPLSVNVPRLSVAVRPSDVPEDGAVRANLFGDVAAALRIPPATLVAAWSEISQQHRRSTDLYVVVPDVPSDEGPALTVRAERWPGVVVVTTALRTYPQVSETGSPSLSHVLGYVGRVTEADLAEPPADRPYRPLDSLGKDGLERSFEATLRGQHGRRAVEVNALGQAQRIIAEDAPRPGQDVWLTIDAELQAVVERSLRRNLVRSGARRGVAVALDPRSGEVLALVSWPTFDANAFSRGLSAAAYRAVVGNPDQPLFDRAVGGLYPSGSTIKPVVAAAALEEGVITDRTRYLSVGGIRAGASYFPDWKAGGHGWVDVRRAIAESVNTFFYIIAGGYEEFPGLGIETLARYARRFGLGERSGLDLLGEQAGLVPTPAWKEAAKHERWFIGDTYHAAIGQGDVLVTPLQVANYMAVFANGGTLYRPHLRLADVDADGAVRQRAAAVVIRDHLASPPTIRVVREGLRQAVTDGSARGLVALPIAVAGKTGTAESGDGRRPHAWFTGFGPYENPEVVVTVLIEEGGEGSVSAVPVAEDVFAWWASRRHDRDSGR